MKFKNNIEKFEFFESYLKNELAPDKKSTFEEALKNDSQLAEEFEEHRNLAELIIDDSILNLKKELGSIHRNNYNKPDSRPRNGSGLSSSNLISLFIGGIIIVTGVLLIVKSTEKDFVSNEISHNKQETEVIEPKTNQGHVVAPVEKEKKTKQVQEETKKESETTKVVSDSIKNKNESQNENREQKDSTLMEQAKNLDQKEVNNSAQPTEKKLATNTPQDKAEPVEEEASVDCEKVNIWCDYKSTKTCTEYYSGEIIVDKKSFSGGTPPYTVSINGGYDYHASKYRFGSLMAGTYNLFVKDKNSCEKEIATIVIAEKICDTDYKYSPGFGELWTIPVEKNKKGIFRLFNKSGQILVEKEINDYSDNTWNGKDDNGMELTMDYYPFVIQYSDGETFKGSVTLIK